MARPISSTVRAAVSACAAAASTSRRCTASTVCGHLFDQRDDHPLATRLVDRPERPLEGAARCAGRATTRTGPTTTPSSSAVAHEPEPRVAVRSEGLARGSADVLGDRTAVDRRQRLVHVQELEAARQDRHADGRLPHAGSQRRRQDRSVSSCARKHCVAPYMAWPDSLRCDVAAVTPCGGGRPRGRR